MLRMILPKLRRVETVGWGTSEMRKEQVGPAFRGFQGFILCEFQYLNINSKQLAKREKGRVGPAFWGFRVRIFVNSKPNIYTPELPKSKKVKKRKGGTPFEILGFGIPWLQMPSLYTKELPKSRKVKKRKGGTRNLGISELGVSGFQMSNNNTNISRSSEKVRWNPNFRDFGTQGFGVSNVNNHARHFPRFWKGKVGPATSGFRDLRTHGA
jgi:hypothetical protein